MKYFTFILLLACGKPAVPTLSSAAVFVTGQNLDDQTDCRANICRHNENTDMIVFKGATYLVHRTAESQILGPNSALHVYRSLDHGATFTDIATIPAINDRDLRDPSFYIVGDNLFLKALTRLPVTSPRDTAVDTIAVAFQSADGVTWTGSDAIGPEAFSFWRVKEFKGSYYSAAYADGDAKVVLFSSSDGKAWHSGPTVYDNTPNTPLETELTFLPSGRLLALVRTDGDNDELLGDEHTETQVCWSEPPYASFACPQILEGVRLDGPVSFFFEDRLFVIARKHLGVGDKKRTSLYELTGKLEGGPLAIKEWLTLPSSGDTSYAGVAPSGDRSFVISWYSSALTPDQPWFIALLGPTDIWTASIRF